MFSQCNKFQRNDQNDNNITKIRMPMKIKHKLGVNLEDILNEEINNPWKRSKIISDPHRSKSVIEGGSPLAPRSKYV